MIDSSRSPLRALLAIAFVCIAALVAPSPARAQQLAIDISNGNPSAIPVAVVPFGFDGGGLPPETDVGEVVRADLARSGQFRTLPKTDIVETPTREPKGKAKGKAKAVKAHARGTKAPAARKAAPRTAASKPAGRAKRKTR